MAPDSNMLSLAGSAPTVVKVGEIRPNDIVLGRGSGPNQHSGNQRFRKLIQARKKKYNATNRHSTKREIALEILAVVESYNGRFVRSIPDPLNPTRGAAASRSGIGRGRERKKWVLASQEVAVEKIMQALREVKTKQSFNDALEDSDPMPFEGNVQGDVQAVDASPSLVPPVANNVLAVTGPNWNVHDVLGHYRHVISATALANAHLLSFYLQHREQSNAPSNMVPTYSNLYQSLQREQWCLRVLLNTLPLGNALATSTTSPALYPIGLVEYAPIDAIAVPHLHQQQVMVIPGTQGQVDSVNMSTQASH